MPDNSPGSSPTFTALEADKIVKVALALKRHDEVASDRGMSPAQLEAIGAEVGLSPDNVREAIAILGGPANPVSLMGAPMAIRLDRELDIAVPRSGDEKLV